MSDANIDTDIERLKAVHEDVRDLKTDIGDIRDDIRKDRENVQHVVDSYAEQHDKLHSAHAGEHTAANTRFWTATGLLASGILAIFGFLVYKGAMSAPIGAVGIGGTILCASVMFDTQIGKWAGGIAARLIQTRPGKRVFNWYMKRKFGL